MKYLGPPSSGSIAGQTHSRNRYGQYVRTRAVPVQPNTAAQSAVKSLLAAATGEWFNGLDQTERNAWNTWAAENPRVDSLGQEIFLSGFQAFVGTVIEVSQALDQFTAPAVPPAEPTDGTPELTSLLVNTAGLITVGFAPTPSPDGHATVVQISPPLRSTQLFVPRYRFAYAFDETQASPQSSGGTRAVDMWGALQVGQQFAARAKYVKDTGASSAWSNVVRIGVTAPA